VRTLQIDQPVLFNGTPHRIYCFTDLNGHAAAEIFSDPRAGGIPEDHDVISNLTVRVDLLLPLAYATS